MVRKIKFRAWNKKQKEWIKEKDFLIYPNGDGHMFHNIVFRTNGDGHISNLDSDVDDDDIELQQWTGLKDKNGKEIYEGDILKHTYSIGFTIYLIKFGKFDNGMNYDDNESGYGYYLESIKEVQNGKEKIITEISTGVGYPIFEELEVIGNIHENPDLLVGCAESTKR